MRVYHFVNARYGIEDIQRRRIKIATLAELNDPFEFFGADLGDQNTRRTLNDVRDAAAKGMGLLCFSGHWHNPVLWSHYADRHRGICLGVEVADDNIRPVTYVRKRFVLKPDPMKRNGAPDHESIGKLMLTKYVHWRYEDEFRAFARLGHSECENDLFFAKFDAKLKLTLVIVGALSPVSRDEVLQALGDLAPDVEIIKARLAFRSFRVVRQRNRELW